MDDDRITDLLFAGIAVLPLALGALASVELAILALVVLPVAAGLFASLAADAPFRRRRAGVAVHARQRRSTPARVVHLRRHRDRGLPGRRGAGTPGSLVLAAERAGSAPL